MAPPATPDSLEQPGPGPRILLVDDNAINQKVAARLLGKLHYQVDIASDGYEAIARATAAGADYQLILMDIQMPRLDGIAATHAIKEQLGAATPPIVAMTAYSMPDDAARFVEAGLDDYLAKPVRHQQLADILTRWIAPPAAKPAPPTPAPAAPALIDPEVLAQLLQLGGVDFVNELYVEFVEETSAILAQANTHWQAANLEGLQPLLHQLKGTAGTLGLTELAGQALALEKAVKHQETNMLTTGIPELNRLFEHFIAHYPTQLTT